MFEQHDHRRLMKAVSPDLPATAKRAETVDLQRVESGEAIQPKDDEEHRSTPDRPRRLQIAIDRAARVEKRPPALYRRF
jgi:hypothetical protein